MATSPTGTLMHSWISVSGSLSVSPVRMLRVQPARLDLRAREADAHPAAVFGAQPGGLGLLEQRRAGVGGGGDGRAKVTVPVASPSATTACAGANSSMCRRSCRPFAS